MNNSNEKIKELEKEKNNIFEKLQALEITETKKIKEFENYIISHINNHIKRDKSESIKHQQHISLKIKIDSLFDRSCLFIIKENTDLSLFNDLGKIEYRYKKYDFDKSKLISVPLDESLNIEYKGIKYNAERKNKRTPKDILEIQQYINLSLISIYETIYNNKIEVENYINNLKEAQDQKDNIKTLFLKKQKEIKQEEENLKLSPIYEYQQDNLANDDYINSVINKTLNSIENSAEESYIYEVTSSEYFYFIEPFDSKKENGDISLVRSFIKAEKTPKNRNSFSIEEIKLIRLELNKSTRNIHKIAKKNILSFLKEKKCLKPNEFLDQYYESNNKLTLNEFIQQCENLLLYKEINQNAEDNHIKKSKRKIL